MKYTKKDLAKIVALLGSINIDAARDVTNTVLLSLHEMLKNMQPGESLELRGIGVFTVKKSMPKPNAHNPKTLERVIVPAKRKLLYKPSSQIKRAHREL